MAEQLAQTDALLNKYANMLSKSETVTRLIFDERWGGADAVSIFALQDGVSCEHAGRNHATCENVTKLSFIRTRNFLSKSKRKPLNGPDLNERGKKRHVKKLRNAHAGKPRRQRSVRRKSVPNKRRQQLLRPRVPEKVEAQALSVVVSEV